MRDSLTLLTSLALLSLPALAEPPITVTLFDRAGLHVDIRVRMKEHSSQIFREVGIQLEWRECETVGQPSADCLLPLGVNRLRMELLAGRNEKTPWIAGVATIQRGPGPSVLASVYPERVQELAMKASWDFGELLGHAVSHEIGHLLLRSSGHAPAGIMRASWEVQDLWRLPHAGLIFPPGRLKGQCRK